MGERVPMKLPSRLRRFVVQGGRTALLCAASCLVSAQSLPNAPTAPSAETNQASPARPAQPPPVPGSAAAGKGTVPVEGDGSAASSTVLSKAQATVPSGVNRLRGVVIDKIQFEGVTFGTTDTLPQELPLKAGDKLDPAKVRESMQRLFASGMYRDISVEGQRSANGVTLIFVGTARFYVGRVTIEGVKSESLTSLLEYSTNLQPGVAFSEAALAAGTDGIRQSLANSGYYQPVITVKTDRDVPNSQVNAVYTVNIGPLARIGQVTVEGTDPGITLQQFRKKGKLKQNAKVGRDTTSNALTRLRAQYQKKDKLEATTTLQKSTYNPARKQLDYDFHANQGPTVKVLIDGVKVSKSRLHLLVPIYEEGTIDNDLLNEGSFNIKDFLFQEGYFDAVVLVKVEGEGTPNESVIYSVDKGAKHRVRSVTIKGNKYFGSELLKERMQVQKADAYQRSGRYSPQLMKADVSSILGLYRANGFSAATIATSTKDVDEAKGKELKIGEIDVLVTITEGAQQKFGTVVLNGVGDSRVKEVQGLMNSQQGQPFSLISLSGDRDAILGYYLSRGFEEAKIEVRQAIDKNDATRTNVTLDVTEGQEIFIKRVLTSGINHVRPSVIGDQVKVHEGDPLDQSALLETQRNLYNLALFNEVVSTVQNPAGDAPRKNVLLQLTEARRWDVTYGFGFEAETGTPVQGQISTASKIQLGLDPNAQYGQQGRTGVSPRVSLDVSRINLRGTDESLTLHTTYGLLERVATLTFNNPHLFGKKQFSNAISGGYSNVQNISTFSASTLQFDYRITEKFKRTDTFIYNFEYRRVAVDPNSLQVSANLIPLLSEPVRVAGPGITWFHDKRQPSPLDATKGSYTSVQDFFASSKFGSQTDFNRTDITNSTYYQFGKKKYVFARSTRLGFERAFGANPNAGNAECAGVLLSTNASCNSVPLPERLYAGGATSHRGFAINGAGPRDLQTGYPVGGSAVFVNTFELRLPAPTLPYVGESVSFVIFHDMGNVFQNVNDMFPSFTRFHQPNQQTCANVSGSIGTCDFNYFSHAVGLGARYKTPVGPIRVDFSYNLNPPVYPVIYDFNGSLPYEGQAGHFNFFFSIGQAF